MQNRTRHCFLAALESLLVTACLLALAGGAPGCDSDKGHADTDADGDPAADDAHADSDIDGTADADAQDTPAEDAAPDDAPTEDAAEDDGTDCVATTCAALFVACGTIDNGCGGTLDCGPCLGPAVEAVEVVTEAASTPDDFPGSAGNYWGGHQPRIVRTSRGEVFTAYMVTGDAVDTNRWHVDLRTPSGWTTVGEGLAGREPVHLVRGPDDTLYLVAWPGLPRLWTSTGSGTSMTFTESEIPGGWVPRTGSSTPYMGSGISAAGDLCLFESDGEAPGRFLYACRAAGEDSWQSQAVDIDYRHCYTFVYPQGDGSLTWVSSRDVLWTSLGYTPPSDAFSYVFNAVTTWSAPSVTDIPTGLLVREQPQTVPGEYVMAYQRDSLIDTVGRLHVLYELVRDTTYEMRHAVVIDGAIAQDVLIVPSIPTGWTDGYYRLLEDSTGRLYWLYGRDTDVFLYPAANEDGTALDDPIPLDLGGHGVTYSGIHVAAPRGGTPPSDYVEAAFPSGDNGNLWVYFRLRLR